MTGPVVRRSEQVTVRRDRQALGQVAPGATTATTLYTCPKGYTATGRVFLCNRAGATTTFRLALRQDGATLGNEHYLAYDAPLAANEDVHTEELNLDSDDVVTVYGATANLSFTFIGREEAKQT